MELDPSRPIWHQLVEEFTRRIAASQWACGARIPGVRELAAELRVNPNTVQRALSELERQELVRTERTSGRYVTSDIEVITAARLRIATQAAQEFGQRLDGLDISLDAARELVARHWPKEGS